MKKKGLIISLSVGMSVVLLAYPLTIGINAFVLPSVYEDTFLGEMKEKIKLLKETDGKRIILIGGSSVPFGVKSSLIEENIANYKVINFGMYASLGSNVMLDFAKARINQDDIVVFMPEQNVQTLSMYYNGKALWQALDGDFSSFWLLNHDTRQRMYGDLYSFSQEKFKFTFQNKLDLGDTIYQKSSFEKHGDIKDGLANYNIMYDQVDPTMNITFDENFDENFLSYVNDFASYVRSKGAHMYYRFAPMNQKAVKDEDALDHYYEVLQDKLELDILGNPHDAILDSEWFYDTNFHLNDAGRIMNTKQLIKDIKLTLDDTSRTEIEDPEKPVIPEDENTKDGDNSDVDCFTYEEKEDYYIITSLLNEKEDIVVPYRYNGKKVIAFSADVFASHKKIKTIRIQDNIRYLYDYSFNGCSALERIYLDNLNPSSINVSGNLLDGCNGDIYVPKEAYSKYIQSYVFGAYYSTRIKTA